MVGAIFLSPTDAVSQEVVVGSAQGVVVARTRAPRDAAVQHCIINLGSEHLGFELEGSARSVVMFESVLPEAAPCVAYALIDLDEQVGILWFTFPPRYTYSFVWLYTRTSASMLNMAVDSGIPFVHKHMISVLASDTVRSNAGHTTTITRLISLNCSGACETTPASSA